MIIIRNILLIFLALLLQASWLNALAIYGIVPDLVTIVLVFIAITRGQIEATVLGFVSGLLIDIYNPGAHLGINALGYSLVSFCVGYSRIGIVSEVVQVQAVILFAATLLHDIIFFLFTLNPIKILTIGLGTGLYTAGLGVVLSHIFTRFFFFRIDPHV